jgi:hypothetical protein
LLGEGGGHRSAGVEVHLVGRLAMEGAVRNHLVVLLDMEANEPPDRGYGVEFVK